MTKPLTRGAFFMVRQISARQGLPCNRPTYCLDANTPARHANAHIKTKTIAIAQSHAGKCAATADDRIAQWCRRAL